MTSAPSAAVVVPLRSFALGKARLARVLDDEARRALAQRMAEQVVLAAGGHPIAVVSSAPEVVTWASARAITCLDDPGTLDLAADAGRAWAGRQSLERVIVVHGDLPFATDLHAVQVEPDTRVAVFVPDLRADGTPVLSVPVDAPFSFAYGPGSFRRHVTAAERAGLTVRVVEDDALGFDVDVPEDLDRLGLPTP